MAGRSAEAIQGPAPRLSVLADRNEWIYRDYANVTRAFVAVQKDAAALRNALDATRSDAIAARKERDSAASLAPTERATLAAEIAAQRDEISRRASFRWWIALPLRRLIRALRGLPPGG